jgi:hypothetical protein
MDNPSVTQAYIKMSDFTKPSGPEGGTPGGSPAIIRAADDAQTTRGLMRENESAIILARAGYNVEQKPAVPGKENPDYKIEGRIFDCYAPSTAKVYNIVDTIAAKVGSGQADRIVLNLDDSKVSLEALRQQFISNPIPGLQEIIIIKEGIILEFFPFSE